MDSKIENILKSIENQEKFEKENPHQIPHSKKVLAIGRDTGIFYNILLKSIQAKNVLEIGMSVGYSTLWFADAVSKSNGKIFTIDHDETKIHRARKNFEDAGFVDLIEIHQGDALDVLKFLKEKLNDKEFFDFIFLDADKERYIQYFDAVLPLLKKGGLIGADNILFPERFQKFTKLYVNHVRNTPKIRSVTIPIDNGEELSLKL
jgi:caffeoyl-CoA O-methyltransferase